MSPDNDRADRARPGVLRRIGRAALSPWRFAEDRRADGGDPARSRRSRAGDRRARREFASMRPAGSISRPWRSCMGRGARRSRRRCRSAAVDGAQCLDLSRPRGDVLSRLALRL